MKDTDWINPRDVWEKHLPCIPFTRQLGTVVRLKKNEKKREKEAAKPVSMWIALFNIAPDKVVLEENKWFLPSQSKPIPARSKSYRDRDLKKKNKKLSHFHHSAKKKSPLLSSVSFIPGFSVFFFSFPFIFFKRSFINHSCQIPRKGEKKSNFT